MDVRFEFGLAKDVFPVERNEHIHFGNFCGGNDGGIFENNQTPRFQNRLPICFDKFRFGVGKSFFKFQQAMAAVSIVPGCGLFLEEHSY